MLISATSIFLAIFLRWFPVFWGVFFSIIAILTNIVFLPRLSIGKRICRIDEKERGFPVGIAVLPVTVLLLILIFGMLGKMYIAGAGWAYMALGVSGAKLVGKRFRSRRWKWTERGTVEGSVAYLIFGSIGAFLLMKWIGEGGRHHVELHPAFLVFVSISGAVLAAFIESLPVKFGGNVAGVLAGSFLIYIFCLIDPASIAVNYHTWNLILGTILSMVGSYYVYRRGYGSNLSAILLGLFGIFLMVFLEIQGFLLLVLFISLLIYITNSLSATVSSPPGDPGCNNDRSGEVEQVESTDAGMLPFSTSDIVSFLAIPLFFAFMSFASAVRPEEVGCSTGMYLLFFYAYLGSLGAAVYHLSSAIFGRLHAKKRFSILTFHAASPESHGTVTVEGLCFGLIASALLGIVAWILRIIPPATVPIVAVSSALGHLSEVYRAAVCEDRFSIGVGVTRIIMGATGGATAIVLYLLYFLKVTL